MNELQMATVEDLVSELASRFDLCVFSGRIDRDEETKRIHAFVGGSEPVAFDDLGMPCEAIALAFAGIGVAAAEMLEDDEVEWVEDDDES